MSMDSFLEDLDLYKISTVLDNIDDETIDKLVNYSLQHCYEALSAGQGGKNPWCKSASFFLDSPPISKLTDQVQEMGMDSFLEDLDLYKISTALDNIDDETIDKLVNYSLQCCYEALPAGNAQVLNASGTYGVAGVEDDLFLTIRLSIEAITWSASSFFHEGRWTSTFQPIANLLQLKQ